MSEVKTRVNVSQADFVAAVINADKNGGTCVDVASETGMKVDSVYQRNRRLIQQGANLPNLKKEPTNGNRGRQAVDIEAINRQIAELAKVSEKEESDSE